MSSPIPSSPPSSPNSSSSDQSNTASIIRLKELLRETIRVRITDGRIFIGTFVGTDQPLNIVLINTEEFQLGSEENLTSRYVGQVVIPWKLVVKVEVSGKGGSDEMLVCITIPS